MIFVLDMDATASVRDSSLRRTGLDTVVRAAQSLTCVKPYHWALSENSDQVVRVACQPVFKRMVSHWQQAAIANPLEIRNEFSDSA